MPDTNRCLDDFVICDFPYRLFRNTLVGAAFVAAAGFFAAVLLILLMVPITVFFTGDLFKDAAFVTTAVPELVLVDWLLLLALPFPTFGAAAP